MDRTKLLNFALNVKEFIYEDTITEVKLSENTIRQMTDKRLFNFIKELFNTLKRVGTPLSDGLEQALVGLESEELLEFYMKKFFLSHDTIVAIIESGNKPFIKLCLKNDNPGFDKAQRRLIDLKDKELLHLYLRGHWLTPQNKRRAQRYGLL